MPTNELQVHDEQRPAPLPNPAEQAGVVFEGFSDDKSLPLSPYDIDRLAEEWQYRRKVFPKQNTNE